MSRKNNEYIAGKLKSRFGNYILEVTEPDGLLTVTIQPEMNVEIISWLNKDEELQFNFLTDITGIHFPDNTGKELGVIYLLHSFVNSIRIRIKAFVDSKKPDVLSVTTVFKSANWMERETYDFYGINFMGHPNLKRILNMDEMDYFPLQKQYPLEDQQREDKTDKYFGR
jgi:NADH-quinone oxidoreductase subunit C